MTAKQMAWIFDIDGTLALRHNQRGVFEWDRVKLDIPNHPVATVAWILLEAGHQIIFVSGRPEKCREDTEAWLATWVHNDSTHRIAGLLMRDDNDGRPDYVVKRELYDNHIKKHYDIQGVFDDRLQVISMWRDLGLTVFDVAGGEY